MPKKKMSRTGGIDESAEHGFAGLDSLEKAVDCLARFVFEIPFWLFCAATAAIVVVRNGVGVFPALSLELSIASALPDLPSLPVAQQYFFSSLTGLILARLLGISSAESFFALHLVVIIITAAAAIAVVYRRDGDERARLLMLAIACSSVPMVLLGWIGSYDPFTVLAILIVTIADSHIVTFVGAILLGFTHFEQGLFVVAIVLILNSHRKFSWVRTPTVLIGGLMLGKAVLMAYLVSKGLGRGRLDYASITGLYTFLKFFVRQFPVLLGSWFGAFWVWMTVAALSVVNRWTELGRWFLATALAATASLLALDETRVFALISLPLIVHVGMDAKELMAPQSRRAAAVLASCIALILPPVFVWEGAVHSTGWSRFILAIRNLM